jgi:regulator of protease activity HflC (stomatin/prohibitin superfamily)
MADDIPVATGATPAASPSPSEIAAIQAAAAGASGAMALQLTQVRVPLDEAAEALSTPDSAGRLPIIVLPRHAFRIRNELVIAGIAVAVVGLLFEFGLALRGTVIGIGGLLVVLGVFQSFLVPVPEGAQAILLRRGRLDRTLGPGNHVVPPWLIVSHIVTTRETPFDAPSVEIPTKDNVRTNVDILLTFRIAAPEKFVFTISAPDFDQICQATCQESVRLLIRSKDSDEVLDLRGDDNEWLRASIQAALEPYGVEIVRVVLTHVLPPLEFIAPREARRLATLQRAEEQEQHALAMLRQADREELGRATIEARRKSIELEAENEVVRLERLETRLRAYPNAMHWDVEGQRLDVARALAANTRAMVQVGAPGVGGDVAAALLQHTLPENGRSSVEAEPPDEGLRPAADSKTTRSRR